MPLCERVQCDLMRMVVRIVDAAGDQRIARGHCVKQGGGEEERLPWWPILITSAARSVPVSSREASSSFSASP